MAKHLWLAAALVCACASLARAEDGGRYLPDIVAGGPQAGALKTMMAGSPPSLAWIAKLEGPSGPSRMVEVSGQRREVAFICKLNRCTDNQFRVLFSADGSFAVGLLIGPGGPQFFGSPTMAERNALIATNQP
ncbi:hypothetical protein JOD31_000103 [Methylopila capsulata]|uniref:Inhibitor of vertebrate lysozyme n=1 Tax=Methylopila capsulata TaxID=61654 RepID=A0A9W6MRN4_9HYPH|nr:Ivy family c-type lysozyme inhibitor [Methylopila capsulata]MBM7849891.1 hypothetical protein [Methylopila capsulata]GLK55181.1 hypothetical protein GCM10008170_12000 [Methylopila capsulata]